MSIIDSIGIFANLLNGGSLIPSIKNVYTTKDLTSYPVLFLVLMVIANIFWIIYGLGKGVNQTTIMGVRAAH